MLTCTPSGKSAMLLAPGGSYRHEVWKIKDTSHLIDSYDSAGCMTKQMQKRGRCWRCRARETLARIQPRWRSRAAAKAQAQLLKPRAPPDAQHSARSRPPRSVTGSIMAEVAQFCEITGGTPEQAAFFLSMAGNNVDNAIAAFFENDGGMGQPSAMQGVEDVVESTPASPQPSISCRFCSESFGAHADLATAPQAPSRPAPSPAPARQPPPAQAPPPAKRSAPAKGNITSLSDLNKGGDDSDDEDAPTEWFAGGHKRCEAAKAQSRLS